MSSKITGGVQRCTGPAEKCGRGWPDALHYPASHGGDLDRPHQGVEDQQKEEILQWKAVHCEGISGGQTEQQRTPNRDERHHQAVAVADQAMRLGRGRPEMLLGCRALMLTVSLICMDATPLRKAARGSGKFRLVALSMVSMSRTSCKAARPPSLLIWDLPTLKAKGLSIRSAPAPQIAHRCLCTTPWGWRSRRG
jgi:hypothetical protein